MRIFKNTVVRNRVMALLAGGVILGVGGSLTLANWTDTEWAYGGNAAGTGPGVGTSTFDVVQDASQPFVVPGDFASFPDNPGDNMTFGPGALTLSPGDSVWATVALTTTAASIAGTLQLNAAVAAAGITAVDPGGDLWAALELEVGYSITNAATAPPTCDAAGFGSYTAITLTGAGLGATPAATTQALSAAGGNVIHYCFQITLPDDADNDLQGRSVSPAWLFDGTSN